jgi:hypothetical protein
VRHVKSKVVTLDYTSYANTPDDFTYMPTSCNVNTGMEVTFKLAPLSNGRSFEIGFTGPEGSPFDNKNIKTGNARGTVVVLKPPAPVAYHYTATITENGHHHHDNGRHCPTIIVN